MIQLPPATLRLAVGRTLGALRTGDLLFVAPPSGSSALDQAILAVGAGTIGWLEKRGAAVKRKDTALHVALVLAGGSNEETSIVDATLGHGVREVSLPAFLRGYSPGTNFFHGVVSGIKREQANVAAAFALSRIGLPYAHDFRSPECGEEAYYCSSLVDYAYQKALGTKLVFTSEPFPLLFEPRRFWDQYYQDMGESVPDCLGSNPTLLLHSPKMRYYETCFDAFAQSCSRLEKEHVFFDTQLYNEMLDAFCHVRSLE